jgi:hypothetical protein
MTHVGHLVKNEINTDEIARYKMPIYIVVTVYYWDGDTKLYHDVPIRVFGKLADAEAYKTKIEEEYSNLDPQIIETEIE